MTDSTLGSSMLDKYSEGQIWVDRNTLEKFWSFSMNGPWLFYSFYPLLLNTTTTYQKLLKQTVG